MALLLIPLLVFSGALLPVLFRARTRAVIAVSAAVGPAAATVMLYMLGLDVTSGAVPSVHLPWLPALGLHISFRLDGWALLFSGLVLGIGLLVILYAHYYLGQSDPAGRFFATLLAFMGAMLGIALSDNLLLLVLFWELTSLASFLLVGYWSDRSDARSGARMALTVTGAGGLCLLGGALMLSEIAGTAQISSINGMGDAIRAHPRYGIALCMILLGAFTKSAQFPFHFWLPNAMAAPTPVSAYLHSATMVKAGIFLLARLHPALSGSDLWFYAVGGTGLATLVFGAWEAMFRHDLKGLLAYSTISHLGLIVFLLGLNSDLATVAAVFHLINHATFKASLFMAAGIIDHEAGTRDMRRLAGLWRLMPVTASLATVAAAAMAGVPFLNGFLSKEMLFEETLSLAGRASLSFVVPALATLAGVFAVAYSTRFVHDVFFNGEPRDLPRVPHEPPRWMRVPMEFLVVACVLVGVMPGLVVDGLLRLGARPVVGKPLPPFDLAVWHGVNAPFLMSLVALAGGLAVYFWLQRRRNLHAHVGSAWTGRVAFERTIASLDTLAGAVMRFTMARTLPQSLRILFVCAMAAVLWPLLPVLPHWSIARYTAIDPVAVAGWIALLATAVCASACYRSRFAALMLVSAAGIIVAATFAYLSAPDLALTQVAVEVVTALVLLVALPSLDSASAGGPRSRLGWVDVTLAAGVGGTLAVAAWWMMTRGGSSVSTEQIARSVPEAGGANVVNVILVDFRGFDTFGEITVLAIAALGIVAMLGRTESPPNERGAPVPVFPGLMVRALVPLALLVSLHLFLRGHNLPGGGFVAGLTTGTALFALGIVDRGLALAPFRADFPRLVAAGLLLAAITGLGVLGIGSPFLTSVAGHWTVPLLGEVHLSTAILFDLGVYLLVVGVVMTVLDEFSRSLDASPSVSPERSWNC
ncbi:MAG: monovalent cation/H+ antiporter subunit A [Betaproteobacteria bacterium]|nr:monovalent cation/H+ antiporter subunit A [Betaproteobacteria bacterium]